MKKQNQDRLKEEDVAAIKFYFRRDRKDSEETNWLMEVPASPTPQVREKLLMGKVYISSNTCTVRNYIAVSRCYKCQGYGHVAKSCRINYEVCAHCAESGHSTRACKSKDKNASCVNCSKAGKKGDQAVSNVNCPMYTAVRGRTARPPDAFMRLAERQKSQRKIIKGDGILLPKQEWK